MQADVNALVAMSDVDWMQSRDAGKRMEFSLDHKWLPNLLSPSLHTSPTPDTHEQAFTITRRTCPLIFSSEFAVPIQMGLPSSPARQGFTPHPNRWVLVQPGFQLYPAKAPSHAGAGDPFIYVMRLITNGQRITMFWWARQDLNLGPTDYESAALTAELRALCSFLLL